MKENRIVPDIIKALHKNKKLNLRNPQATRPWQHVLEPLFGYLLLGNRLLEKILALKFYLAGILDPIHITAKSFQYCQINRKIME